jgi:hypothetical protein
MVSKLLEIRSGLFTPDTDPDFLQKVYGLDDLIQNQS